MNDWSEDVLVLILQFAVKADPKASCCLFRVCRRWHAQSGEALYKTRSVLRWAAASSAASRRTLDWKRRYSLLALRDRTIRTLLHVTALRFTSPDRRYRIAPTVLEWKEILGPSFIVQAGDDVPGLFSLYLRYNGQTLSIWWAEENHTLIPRVHWVIDCQYLKPTTLEQFVQWCIMDANPSAASDGSTKATKDPI
ncbi:Hypothetical protein UVM_LOCUS485 [uncultured virus]|nr:Hypothetical protein UVM_LOCUS485 [uncultured virus]